MTEKIPSREDAFALLKEYNSSESLIKHALSVEAVMRHVAEQKGEDPDKWGVIGHTIWTMKCSRSSTAQRPVRFWRKGTGPGNISGQWYPMPGASAAM